MKKIIILIIMLVVFIVGLGLGFYLGRRTEIFSVALPFPFIESKAQKSATEETILDKDEFSTLLPEGWSEASAPTGTAFMAIDNQTEVTDPDAQRVNFKPYYAISYDVLGERSFEEYIEYIKQASLSLAPDTSFTFEDNQEGENYDTYFMEVEMSQQNVDYKVLIVLNAKGPDIWALSFNTTKDNWASSKDLFYQIAESFEIKK